MPVIEPRSQSKSQKNEAATSLYSSSVTEIPSPAVWGEQRGKRLLGMVVAIVVLSSALVIFGDPGAVKIIKGLLWSTIAGLAFFGKQWARIALGVYYCLGVVRALFGLTQVSDQTVPGLGANGLLIGLLVVLSYYIFCVWALLFSASVKAYIHSQVDPG